MAYVTTTRQKSQKVKIAVNANFL